MRRILAIFAAGLLVVAFAGSTAATTTRLVDAHALLALDGVPVGWVDAHLTAPTAGDPTPGVIEFTPLADSGAVAWEAIVKTSAFYWSDYDPDLGGSLPAAWAPSMQCTFWAPGDYACSDLQVWMVDGTTFGTGDWFVTAPEDGPQTWYSVVSGNIEVQRPTS